MGRAHLTALRREWLLADPGKGTVQRRGIGTERDAPAKQGSFCRVSAFLFFCDRGIVAKTKAADQFFWDSGRVGILDSFIIIETDDGHAVLSQSSGLIGTDDIHAAKRLGGRQLADDCASGCQASDADSEYDRDDGGEAFWYGGYS